MTNIDAFNKQAAVAFALLYESFPSPMNLHPLQLLDPSWKEGDPFEWDDSEATFVRAQDCLKWLHKHGYFDGYAISDGCISYLDAVLTPKRLEAMSRTPEILEGKEPLGARVVKAVKSTGK